MRNAIPSKEEWDNTLIIDIGRPNRYDTMAAIFTEGYRNSANHGNAEAMIFHQAHMLRGKEKREGIGSLGWRYTYEEMVDILDTSVRLAKLQVMA